MAKQYLSGLIAFLVCACVLPLVGYIARHFDLYDQAGPIKIHSGSIPRLGGIAMMAGLLAGCAPFLLSTSKPVRISFFVFGGVWLVGLVDDLKSLPSVVRLCSHLAAGAALWSIGLRPELFHPANLDLAVTSFFVAFLINAMNLLDGMDGLAAGTAAMVATGFIVTSLGETNRTGLVVAICLLGICAGMLIVNAPPANMFMGDSGSTLLGIVLAFLSLNSIRNTVLEAHSFVTPLVFLAIPLADAILAILRRVLDGTSPFAGDRRHFYDILLQRGLSMRRVLCGSLFATLGLVCLGLLNARGALSPLWTIATVILAIGIAARVLGSLKPSAKRIEETKVSRAPAFKPVESTPFSSGDGNVIL